jgi:hypothetical protein
MRADLVVIRRVILQHGTQLRFVEHDQVIERFAPNRADEALTWPFCHGERGAVG